MLLKEAANQIADVQAVFCRTGLILSLRPPFPEWGTLASSPLFPEVPPSQSARPQTPLLLPKEAEWWGNLISSPPGLRLPQEPLPTPAEA